MKVLDFGVQKTTGPSSGGAVACILLVSPGLDCLRLAEIVCCLSEVSILATKKGSLVFELCVTTHLHELQLSFVRMLISCCKTSNHTAILYTV